MNAAHGAAAAAKETARIEAFSDGVFAIAITLLVLDLKVPHDMAEGRDLAAALWRQWPAYLAFVTSFATICIMWINHRRMFTLIGRADDGLLVLNGLLLFLLWWYAAHYKRLLRSAVDRAVVQAMTRGYSIGPLCYALAFGLAFVSVPRAFF